MTRFYPYPIFSDNCFVVLPVGRPLWREDGSVTYSAITDWSGHWGPITIHYRLIWDCDPYSSPLTARRDYSGGILTSLHTGSAASFRIHYSLIIFSSKPLEKASVNKEQINQGTLMRTHKSQNTTFDFKPFPCLLLNRTLEAGRHDEEMPSSWQADPLP
jgi:hypothetical protein